jgi:hypothetical protein
VTIHPAAILRVPDEQNRKAEEHRFIDDLRRAGRVATAPSGRERKKQPGRSS